MFRNLMKRVTNFPAHVMCERMMPESMRVAGVIPVTWRSKARLTAPTNE